jgi:membrane protein DedA with SNARE-associated domain
LDRILSPIIDWAMHVIKTLGYPGIVLLMAIESACIPLPSEVIMPFSGALCGMALAASQVPPIQPFNLHLVALVGAVGCALGSALAYWVGAVGGRPFVERRMRFLIRKRDLDRADRWFIRWGGWAVFISRLLPVVRTFISLPAGIARMRFLPFMVLSFIGSVPWCYLLAYIGLKLGERWDTLKAYFHKADLVIGIALAALILLWIWHHFRAEKDETLATSPVSAPSDAHPAQK